MRRLSALLALGLAGLACAAGPVPGSAAETGRPLAIESLAQRSVPGQSGGREREVYRDAAAFRAGWSKLEPASAPAAEPPAVDFATRMVIAVALPTQSCISRITVRAVVEQETGLVVDLLEEPASGQCVCIVAERPHHVVAVPRSDKPVRFVATVEPRACGPR
ncbi:MAG TPA: hypothetical protein VN783_10595 [Thermoanaerobaculia bacterium]|nr:hypothetical protein [Thermoanaerobaculia bacterium]